jgi:shikimate 5-dehydrogenase
VGLSSIGAYSRTWDLLMHMSRVYFLGVNTAGSAAHKMFPYWIHSIGRQASLVGVDLMLESSCESYQKFLKSIRLDERCLGAQITSHKVRVYDCAGSELDEVDRDARNLGEIGAIAVSEGRLTGFSPDMLALSGELSVMLTEDNPWPSPREVIILGGGGAGRAIALSCAKLGRSMISKITITELSAVVRADLETRLTSLIVDRGGPELEIRDGRENDAAVAAGSPGSLIANATGRGKDSVGSPLSPAALLPVRSIAWDLNYRGDLDFLRFARVQAQERGLHVVDGWSIFCATGSRA